MKKFLISAIFIIGFGSYAAYNYFTTTTASAVSVATSTTAIPAVNVTQTSDPASISASEPSAPAITQTTPVPVVTTITQTTTASLGQYKNGTYTGTVADAYYGNIQVEAVISGGKLTNVVFLQYPNDRSTSRAINTQAMPQLKAEAIQNQSAKVDGVSGASDTDAAFEQSLASALAQATA
jgi:uncharacterized protein with FMN-binding domain